MTNDDPPYEEADHQAMLADYAARLHADALSIADRIDVLTACEGDADELASAQLCWQERQAIIAQSSHISPAKLAVMQHRVDLLSDICAADDPITAAAEEEARLRALYTQQEALRLRIELETGTLRPEAEQLARHQSRQADFERYGISDASEREAVLNTIGVIERPLQPWWRFWK